MADALSREELIAALLTRFPWLLKHQPGKIVDWFTDRVAAKPADDPERASRDAKLAVEVREGMIEKCASIALAIDSGRGNEKEIAKAIRALSSSGQPKP